MFFLRNILVEELVKGMEYEPEVIKFKEEFLKENITEKDIAIALEKGCFTGQYVINPLNNEKFLSKCKTMY